MTKKNVKKVLVIGSGPIVIGQAAEFDYAGTQACRSLKEEGMEVILVNSNPSTIMTDVDIADRVYIETNYIAFCDGSYKEGMPDALLATLGGQVGLNSGGGSFRGRRLRKIWCGIAWFFTPCYQACGRS